MSVIFVYLCILFCLFCVFSFVFSSEWAAYFVLFSAVNELCILPQAVDELYLLFHLKQWMSCILYSFCCAVDELQPFAFFLGLDLCMNCSCLLCMCIVFLLFFPLFEGAFSIFLPCFFTSVRRKLHVPYVCMRVREKTCENFECMRNEIEWQSVCDRFPFLVLLQICFQTKILFICVSSKHFCLCWFANFFQLFCNFYLFYALNEPVEEKSFVSLFFWN